MRRFLLILTLLTAGLSLSGQDSLSNQSKGLFYDWGISGNVGSWAPLMDIGNRELTNIFSSPSMSYGAGAWVSVSHFGILQLAAFNGDLKMNETYSEGNDNFKADFWGGGVEFLVEPMAFIKPYRDADRLKISLGSGIHYYQFATYKDLYDASGRAYHYWEDGSIRNLPEGNANAIEISRDYDYETRLYPQDGSNSGLSVPLTFSVAWQISPIIKTELNFSRNYILSDNVDLLETGTNNDEYVEMNVSLKLNLAELFRGRQKDSVDLIVEEDSDNDGILDFEDECMGTPEGVEVDSRGCALDKDKDGVADYQDEDLNTPKGQVVDLKGKKMDDKPGFEAIPSEDVMTTDEMKRLDSLKSTNPTPVKEVPSGSNSSSLNEEVKEGDQLLEIFNLPEEKKEEIVQKITPVVDKNQNGEIGGEEIKQVVQEKKEGSVDVSEEEIYLLIDQFLDK